MTAGNDNDRVTVAVLKNELHWLRKAISGDVKEKLGDHETRLRRLEGQSLLKWIVQGITVVAAAFGIRTGWGSS